MTEYDEEFLTYVYFKGKGIYMKRIKAFIVENKLFSLFFLGMAVYYAVSMFAIKPWYDELYTYYSFISRGPVYAAIHWPVPNNHVFYSVLSAFLDYLGSPISDFVCFISHVLCQYASFVSVWRRNS